MPNIDIKALFGDDPVAFADTAVELGRAAADVGFMYVSGAPVANEVFDRMLAAAQAFFALPMEQKMQVYIGKSTNHRGYVPEGEEVFVGATVDKKEAFDLSYDLRTDDGDGPALPPLLGPNQWPALDGFAEAVSDYYTSAFDAGHALMRGFAVALGLPVAYFDPYLTRPPSQLRLIHYPFDAAAADRPGIGAHTDYECLTVLKCTAPGLEVRNGNGDWIDVPPVEGSYVVNIGDLLELWTNGELIATEHRVRKVAEERYAFPLFFTVDYHTVVAPMDKFITAQRPAREPLHSGEHLFAQTAQTFQYMRRRIESGEAMLPEHALPLSSFGPTVARA